MTDIRFCLYQMKDGMGWHGVEDDERGQPFLDIAVPGGGIGMLATLMSGAISLRVWHETSWVCALAM